MGSPLEPLERAIRTYGYLATLCLSLWALGEPVAGQAPGTPLGEALPSPPSGCAAVVNRPCVGLVLGGGGARGGAHIGVLQVLEELRVPVDVIAGTSIGAIVGGLYAIGLSADDIETITDSLDWQQLFRGSPPREDLAYRRKQDDVRFPVQLELGLDGRGVRLPRGLITGQSLHTLLSGLGLAVGSVTDFDAMPIPFRAIAADLADGTPVSLDSGDLARAIRASMSIPGLFVPIEIDDRLLIDGGISQNVPVSVVQEMGADFVIAVDVATPPDPLDALGTAVAISRHIVRFPIQRATQVELNLLSTDDIVLKPDLSNVRASDFPSTLEAAEAGAVAARKVAGQLLQVALSEDQYQAWRTQIGSQRLPTPIVEAIRLDNRSGLADQQLRDLVAQEVGAPLEVERLAEDIARIYGLGFFESVTYHVEGLADTPGATPAGVLVITVVPEPWGPHYLRVGLGFRDDLGGNSAFSFLGGYTLTQLNRWGAELRSQVELGQVRRISSEWYQPLGGGGSVFLAPTLSYQRDILDVYADRSRVAQRRRTQWDATFDLGVRLGNWGEFRAGITRGKASLKTRTGIADSINIEDALGRLHATLSIDRLDSRSFPRSGDAFSGVVSRSLPDLGSAQRYSRVAAQYLRAQPVGGGSLLVRLEGGTSLGDQLPLWDEFALGGLFRLSGVRDRSFTGDDMALAGLTYYRPLATLPTTLSGGDLLLGLSLEAGQAWDTEAPLSFSDVQVGGSGFLGLETLLGPVYLGYGRAEAGEGAWYFILGRTF